jgi:hypothetical protein
MLGREGVEGQQLRLGLLEQPGDLGRRPCEPVDDLTEPFMGLGQAGGLEDPADRGGDHGLVGLADVAEHVAQEVHGAALPWAAEHFGDRLSETLVGIRDAQAHTGQPAGPQATQELAPERLALGLANIQTEDLAAPVWWTP